MEKEDLLRGITAAKAGNFDLAQKLLAGVVQRDPGSEEGWLWLGHSLTDQEKRLYCYQMALALNPHNESARQGIQALAANNQPARQGTSGGKPTPPAAPAPLPSSAGNKSKSENTLGTWLSIIIPVLFVFLCVIPLLYLGMTGKLQALADRYIPSRPQQPLQPVASVIATASLTPSSIPATATASPTSTASSTPTATFTPTPSFKPGDPTATPLGSDITDPDFVAGLKAYHANNYQEVISRMTAAIQTNPDLAPAYHYRGKAYWNLKNCQSGLADQEKALALNPDYASAWGDRALDDECLGNKDQVLSDFENALALNPSNATIINNLGLYYYNAGDFPQSLEEYRLAVAIDPTQANYWDGLSEAEDKLGLLDECINSASKAIEIDPEIWHAFTDRGYCYLDQKKYAQAVTDYKVYLAHVPNDAISWNNYGVSLKYSGDIQGALFAYSKALILDPSYYFANINRAIIYREKGQYDMALADDNTALKSGDIPIAFEGRGYVYYGLKDYYRAIVDFQTAIELNPSDANSYAGLSYSYFEIGRYQDALDAGATAIQIDPQCDCWKVAQIQARSYYALGEYDQALTYINKSINMGWYLDSQYYRGIIYQAMGNNAKAIQDFEMVIKSGQANNYYGPEVTDAIKRLKTLKP